MFELFSNSDVLRTILFARKEIVATVLESCKGERCPAWQGLNDDFQVVNDCEAGSHSHLCSELNYKHRSVQMSLKDDGRNF